MKNLRTLALLAALLTPAAAWAQEKVELKGSSWVATKELSLERLKGKVVVLLFYEEECPRCIEAIPERNALRKSFAGKPVQFIAINSGNPRQSVEEYAKSNKLEWPILVDDRNETEKQFGFKISLNNIYQWIIYDPEGNRVGGTGSVAEIVNGLLPKATWLFDGIAVPERLKPAAHDIEFGIYEPAIGDVATLAQKGPKSEQEAAAAMFDKVRPMAVSGLEKAKAFAAEGKKYAAYVEYARVATWFKRTEYEKTAVTAINDLKKDKEVQEELTAKQLLDQAKTLLGSTKKSDRESAPQLLALIQKKYPNSAAAKDAAKLSQ